MNPKKKRKNSLQTNKNKIDHTLNFYHLYKLYTYQIKIQTIINSYSKL